MQALFINRRHDFFQQETYFLFVLPGVVGSSHLWTVSGVQQELPLWKTNRLFHVSSLPLQQCIGG